MKDSTEPIHSIDGPPAWIGPELTRRDDWKYELSAARSLASKASSRSCFEPEMETPVFFTRPICAERGGD